MQIKTKMSPVSIPNFRTQFRFLVIIFIALSSSVSLAQRDTVFFKFESESEKTYLKEDGSGNLLKEKLFQRNDLENGNVNFFIEELLFIHQQKMDRIVTSNSKIVTKELLSPEEVKYYVLNIQEKYPLGYKYPSKEFPKMYVVERGKRCSTLYEVKWQYYNE